MRDQAVRQHRWGDRWAKEQLRVAHIHARTATQPKTGARRSYMHRRGEV